MVVDPKTTTASAEGFTSFGGGRQSMGPDRRTGEWTNQLPPYEVVPLSRQKTYGIQCRDEGNTPVCKCPLGGAPFTGAEAALAPWCNSPRDRDPLN
jgi:hypothetical protein